MAATRLRYSNAEPSEELSSAPAAVERIAEIAELRHEGAPVGAMLDRETGESLLVVMVGQRGMMCFYPRDYNGERSFHTIGVELVEGVFEYYLLEAHSEAPLDLTVPRDRILDAVGDFVANGGLPRAVAWERD